MNLKFILLVMHPSQQLFSHVGTISNFSWLEPGLSSQDKESCFRTQHSASIKASFLPLSHCTHINFEVLYDFLFTVKAAPHE